LTTHLSGNAVSLYELDLTGSVALVFGNEHSGVSDEIRTMGDGDFLIPQVGIIQSLNISVACAVSVYEAYRQKQAAGHYNRPEGLDTATTQVRSEWGLPPV
jgi:tRNA (guanosine-2'-O-)-methyltransferase